jgi:outer membrane murein-binding lipoprotein Lpp
MASRILLAHPNSAATQARAVTAQLEALGYEVGALTPRARRTGAQKVVMLWSRAAWGTPALRAAARKAHAAGKLVCIRLDSAPPPVQGARGTTLKKGLAWRRLLSAKARPVAVTSRPARARIYTARAKRVARPAETVGTDMRVYSESSSRAFAVVLAVLLLGAVGLGVAYTRYPAVASPIDQAATAAYTQASEIAALAP